MRRALSGICFTLALLCPWSALRADHAAGELFDDLSEFVGPRSADELLLLVPAPAGEREPGIIHDSPEAYLEAVRYRPIDNTYSYITSAAANDAFYSDSQFIGYGFGQQTTTV